MPAGCNCLALWFFAFMLMMGVFHQLRGQTQQEQFRLKVMTDDTLDPRGSEILQKAEQRWYRTASQAETAAHTLPGELHKHGYLLASVDSLWVHDSIVCMTLYCGQRLSSTRLVMSHEDISLAELLGVPIRNGRTLQLPGQTIQALSNALLQQGYPLSEVSVQRMEISGDTLFTHVSVATGRFYVWDSLSIAGNLDIDNKVLQRLLRMREGKPYNNFIVREIEQNIGTLPFLAMTQEYSIVLTSEGKAQIRLTLEKKKASGFNGLIGFGPDRVDPSKLTLSGDVALKLHNTLGFAEEMEMKWNGIQGDQNLFLFYRQPYLPFAPFGIMVRFELFRKGETYYTMLQRAGLVVRPTPGALFTVWAQRTGSRVLDRTIYTNAITLPPFADVEATLFGISWQRRTLDVPVNPLRGYLLDGELGGGARKLILSSDIPEGLYQGVETTTRNVTAAFSAELFLPLSRRWVVRPAIRMATLYGGNSFENNLFFIGGIHTLRGFDERSVTASTYALGSLELRYRFEQSAHFKLFLDGGWYEKRIPGLYLNDTPIGFGAGLNLPSPAGIIQVSYGWGITPANPFDIRTGRLHVGIEARF